VSPGKQKVKEDEERSHNELRQLFIDKYRTGHFDSIQSLEKVIKECQILLKETEKPREKNRLENLIKVTDKELLKMRNRTSQVLKNANRMQRQLDSIINKNYIKIKNNNLKILYNAPPSPILPSSQVEY
jgi:hypothetical protein